MRRKRLLSSVVVTALLAGSAFLTLASWRQPRPATIRERLIAALGAMRPVPGRLMGVPYSTLTPQSSPRLSKEARARVREILASSPPVADVALAQLVSGELSRATKNLEMTTARGSEDGRLLSDLSAAYLARGIKEGKAADLFLALRAAEKSVGLTPELREARFNLALVLDQLSLLAQAETAWNDYLNLDPDSEWAEEARHYLKSLKAPLLPSLDRSALDAAALRQDVTVVGRMTAGHPQQVRLYAEKELLSRWANAYAQGDKVEATRLLRILREVGNALVTVCGDPMVRDSIEQIDLSREAPSQRRLLGLVAGHRAYAQGLALLEKQRDREALARFQRASCDLAAAGSPFRFRALLRAATCAKNMLDHQQVLGWLAQIRSAAEITRYPNLSGEVFWMAGVTNSSLANFSSAQSLYESAIPFFLRTGEQENVAFLHFLMAENLRYQGDEERAWDYRYAALKAGRLSREAVWFHNTLLDSAEAALRRGMPETALRFQDEMVANALSGGTLVSKVEAFLRRGRVRHRVGAEAEADGDLRAAKDWLASMSPGEVRDRLAAEIQIAAGEAILESEPQRAAMALTQGIDLFSRKNPSRLPSLFLERARAWRSAGSDRQGEEDLEAAVQLIEAQSATFQLETLKAETFVQAREAFGSMIDLKLSKDGDRGGSLLLADRFLSDVAGVPGKGDRQKVIPSEATARQGLRSLQMQIPPGVSIVEYFIGAKSITAWIVDRDSLASLSIPVAAAEVHREVEALRSAMAGRYSALQVAPRLERLYRILVQPLAKELPPRPSVVFVPDDWLYLVPYSALMDPETGHHLIEDRTVSVAPSIEFYLRGRRQHTPKASHSRMLAVGNPEFDRRRFSGWEDLPDAEKEARRTAEMFHGDVLIGRQATKAAFLANARQYGLIHWAGHAKSNSDYPSLSFLLMAPEGDSSHPEDAGVLYAHEIRRLRLPETRLVVLAACGGLDGGVGKGRGTASLALPFLSAGVPVVIGNLWPVPDSQAAEFFFDFYSVLKQGRDPVFALRHAQLEALSHGDSRRQGSLSWAGFEALGGL